MQLLPPLLLSAIEMRVFCIQLQGMIRCEGPGILSCQLALIEGPAAFVCEVYAWQNAVPDKLVQAPKGL